MKKLFFLLALTAAVSCNAPQELTVMTLNMRYDNPEDGRITGVSAANGSLS